MASISFTKDQILVQYAPSSDTAMHLALQISDDVLTRLRQEMSGLIENPTTELKLSLSEGWTVYFKMREGDSRQYLSHPEVDQWVATCALNRGHLELLIQRLENLRDGAFNLGDLATIQSLSNLEVRWEHRGES